MKEEIQQNCIFPFDADRQEETIMAPPEKAKVKVAPTKSTMALFKKEDRIWIIVKEKSRKLSAAPAA